jgi:hypothetical protein
MTQPLNLGNICGSSIPGVRKITLPDGDQVGLIGLDAVMEALYKEGKLPDHAVAGKNYISDSSSAQDLYRKALLIEYQRFVERKRR